MACAQSCPLAPPCADCERDSGNGNNQDKRKASGSLKRIFKHVARHFDFLSSAYAPMRIF
jgi:hypothetical protein